MGSVMPDIRSIGAGLAILIDLRRLRFRDGFAANIGFDAHRVEGIFLADTPKRRLHPSADLDIAGFRILELPEKQTSSNDRAKFLTAALPQNPIIIILRH